MATNANESGASRKDAHSRKDEDISDSTSPSDSDGESSSEEAAAQKVEWLATTRARRSTAGNRMKAMLANEEPAAEDSDLELLFAEDEDDAGFTDVENDASDVQMDSSSDDEDQEEGADDLEGEKELERQAREKKNAQRKRKANEAIPAKFRKKVRIEHPVADSASVSSAAPQQQHKPRPKKKSERLSWLPTAADMPTRASERRTTKMSKEQLHQKMVKDEIRRKKQIEAMEKKAARLEAMKKPPMTQAERLAEAALVEKRNSKSLNRWEVAEKQREEERLKKIAALNSRKLDGPVVTFWSGIQELEEGQLKHVGKMVSIEEKAPRKKRQSAAAILAAKELENAKSTGPSIPPSPSTPGNPGANPLQPIPVDSATGAPEVKPAAPDTTTIDQTVPPQPPEQPQEQSQAPRPAQEGPPPQPPPAVPETPVETAADKPPESVPNQTLLVPPPAPLPPAVSKQPSPPILAPPVLAPPVLDVQTPMTAIGLPAPNAKSNFLAAPNTEQTPSQSCPAQSGPTTSTPVSSQPGQAAPAISTAPSTSPNIATSNSLQPGQGKAMADGPDTPQQATPTDPPREGKVTKSCILLQNFDEDAIKDKQVQTQILFGRKMNRLAKPAHAALCVITNHPARYRDPKTGLPFYNTHAYKEIQRALRGDYKFSSLIGAYVGSTKYAARGVPERFLDPTKPRSTPTAKPDEPNKGEKVSEVKQEKVTGEQQQQQQSTMPLPVIESRLEPALPPAPAPAPAPVRKQKSTAARSRVNSPMSQTQQPQPQLQHPTPITGPVFTPSTPVNPAQVRARHQAPAPGSAFAPPAPGPAEVQAQARSRTQPPAPVAAAGFAPLASGQPHTPSQFRPHIPVTGAVFAPIHGPSGAPSQPPAPASGLGFVSHAPKQGYTPLPPPGPGFVPPIPGHVQGRSPAPTTSAVFAPPLQGQPQVSSHPQGPAPGDASASMKGPAFAPTGQGQVPPQPQSHHRPHAHVPPPPALPGSAEEAIASVRINRISTPPVGVHQTPDSGT